MKARSLAKAEIASELAQTTLPSVTWKPPRIGLSALLGPGSSVTYAQQPAYLVGGRGSSAPRAQVCLSAEDGRRKASVAELWSSMGARATCLASALPKQSDAASGDGTRPEWR